MIHISDRISTINESQTLGMAKLGRELKNKGIDIINLSLGEPDFQTPEHIKEAAIQAIRDNFTYYPPVAGYQDLREAISNKFKRDNHLDYSPNNIMVSTGAKHSIMNVILSLVNPGDEVIIPIPYWVSYSTMVTFAEGQPVYVKSTIDTDFKPSIEAIEKAITPKTKLLIYSSPCNPSGSVMNEKELKDLADLIERHPQIYVISDEIYEHINFIGKHLSIASYSNIFERVITVNGVAKGFSMTGWRIGYIGDALPIIQACEKLQGQFTSGACSISQKAAVAALNGPLQPTIDMKEAFLRRRNLIVDGFKKMPNIRCNNPEGAFYIFPDISAYFGTSYENYQIKDAQDFAMILLEKANVATVTGDAFGSPENLRISYAASDTDIQKAIDRIGNAISLLK